MGKLYDELVLIPKENYQRLASGFQNEDVSYSGQGNFRDVNNIRIFGGRVNIDKNGIKSQNPVDQEKSENFVKDVNFIRNPTENYAQKNKYVRLNQPMISNKNQAKIYEQNSLPHEKSLEAKNNPFQYVSSINSYPQQQYPYMNPSNILLPQYQFSQLSPQTIQPIVSSNQILPKQSEKENDSLKISTGTNTEEKTKHFKTGAVQTNKVQVKDQEGQTSEGNEKKSVSVQVQDQVQVPRQIQNDEMYPLAIYDQNQDTRSQGGEVMRRRKNKSQKLLNKKNSQIENQENNRSNYPLISRNDMRVQNYPSTSSMEVDSIPSNFLSSNVTTRPILRQPVLSIPFENLRQLQNETNQQSFQNNLALTNSHQPLSIENFASRENLPITYEGRNQNELLPISYSEGQNQERMLPLSGPQQVQALTFEQQPSLQHQQNQILALPESQQAQSLTYEQQSSLQPQPVLQPQQVQALTYEPQTATSSQSLQPQSVLHPQQNQALTYEPQSVTNSQTLLPLTYEQQNQLQMSRPLLALPPPQTLPFPSEQVSSSQSRPMLALPAPKMSHISSEQILQPEAQNVKRLSGEGKSGKQKGREEGREEFAQKKVKEGAKLKRGGVSERGIVKEKRLGNVGKKNENVLKKEVREKLDVLKGNGKKTGSISKNLSKSGKFRNEFSRKRKSAVVSNQDEDSETETNIPRKSRPISVRKKKSSSEKNLPKSEWFS